MRASCAVARAFLVAEPLERLRERGEHVLPIVDARVHGRARRERAEPLHRGRARRGLLRARGQPLGAHEQVRRRVPRRASIR